MVQSVFKSCVISVNRMDTLASLMLLEMIDFDAILGIDWFASYHAIVDCHAKIVKFEVLDGPSFISRGGSCLTPTTLISSLASLRFMDKGNPGFLTLIRNVQVEVPNLD